jgi:DNA invertase Pin-like site-specific DNA recombinase
MIEYSKKELEDLYLKYGSLRKVAKNLDIPKSSLKLQFKKYDIKILADNIKKDDINLLFKELGSVKKVADRLDVSVSTLYYFIDKHQIKNIKKRFPYTKKELELLHQECGSITKVATKLSKNYSTVRYWFKELGIKINDSGMTIFQELRNTPMSMEQKSALLGSMLGDGGIWLAPHSKNARLYVSHCEKQLGYLKWLHDIFNPFSRPIKLVSKSGKKIIAGNEVNASNFYRFYTIAHPDITELYKQYYRKNLKGVDNTLIDKVDLIAMSIWFADDGSILRNKKGEPVSCEIATCSFTYKEHLILVEVLRKFFSGTIKIDKHYGLFKGAPRTDYRIRMTGKKQTQEFLERIKFVLPHCIHYKLS